MSDYQEYGPQRGWFLVVCLHNVAMQAVSATEGMATALAALLAMAQGGIADVVTGSGLFSLATLLADCFEARLSSKGPFLRCLPSFRASLVCLVSSAELAQ